MTTDVQTQGSPLATSPAVAAAATEPTAPGSVQVAPEESIQRLYETGLAKLHSMHERWASALAEVREAQTMDEPEEAAA